MRYLVVVLDGECPAESTLTSTHYDREAAKHAAKNLTERLPGHTVAVYEWATGYSSKTEVIVTQEWCPPPEPPVQELPSATDPHQDIEYDKIAGLTD